MFLFFMSSCKSNRNKSGCIKKTYSMKLIFSVLYRCSNWNLVYCTYWKLLFLAQRLPLLHTSLVITYRWHLQKLESLFFASPPTMTVSSPLLQPSALLDTHYMLSSSETEPSLRSGFQISKYITTFSILRH